MAPISSRHHHLYRRLLQWAPAGPGSPGKWPLKQRETRQCSGVKYSQQLQKTEDDKDDARLMAIFKDNLGRPAPECLHSGFY